MSRVDLKDLNWGQPPDPRDGDAVGTTWCPEARLTHDQQPDVSYNVGLLQALDMLIVFFEQKKGRKPKRVFVPEDYRQILLDETNARLPEDRHLESVKKLGEYDIIYFTPRPEFEFDAESIFVR